LVDSIRDRRDTRAENCSSPSVNRAFDVSRQEDDLTPTRVRTLKTVKGARMELCKLYHQTKAGEIEPHLAGRLAHILGLLISSYREHAIDDRLTEIESRLARIQPNSHARANGLAMHR
jgi:hypothetical protein